MNRFIENIKQMLYYFSIIAVVVMTVSAGYITVFQGVNSIIETKVLWQILLVSFLCAQSYWFFYTRKSEIGKSEFRLRWIFCFLYVNGVVLGLGYYFKWFLISSMPMVIGMEIAIVVAFLLISGCVFLMDLKTTDAINKKLQERNGETK